VGIDFARAQIEAGADTIGVGDAICSQVSPRIYEQYILPRQQRLMQAIHGLGAVVRLHICGNITHLLAGIASLPVDVLDVDHMVDIRRVRDALGQNVTLGGNIDPVAGVMQGTVELIRQTTLETYRKVGNPFFVNAGCEIPPGTPPENLRALCEPIPYQE
jgi:MtaA/CmuA family methyltransferase